MKLILNLTLFMLILPIAFSAQTPIELANAWETHHISTMSPSDVRHNDLKVYLAKLSKLGLKVVEVGRSNANREIYQMEFGTGPLKVFFWSQMHGDEPTATSALIDMLAYLKTHPELPWVKQISEKLTIRVVPMLNPDGAEAYQRRNLQGIDINRDALDLQTPEARLLKRLRDEWQPDIGFNLHNQQELTTVGRTPLQAAISLLVVYGDAAKTTNVGHERNQRLASLIITALNKFIPGHIARYDDGFTPTAFGDNFSAWGTPVILIETGALHGKDEIYLVKMNFVAFMSVLNALADGSESTQSTLPYLSLLGSSSGRVYNFIFRQANVLASTESPITTIADVSVNTIRRRESFAAPNMIRQVGDLTNYFGLSEYDVSGFTMVQRLGTLKPGELGEFLFYKTGRIVNWRSADLFNECPPDAVFSDGRWIKGEELIRVIRN